MRINKFISETGICSRREADKWIEEKRVSINGEVAQLGSTVDEGDEVRVDGKLVGPKKKHIYIALNKPVGITCTTEKHIKGLTRLLDGLKCRINLIRFHPIPGSPLRSSKDETITWFRDSLTKKGITTTIRASRGEDIYAACGLLSTKEQAD